MEDFEKLIFTIEHIRHVHRRMDPYSLVQLSATARRVQENVLEVLRNRVGRVINDECPICFDIIGTGGGGSVIVRCCDKKCCVLCLARWVREKNLCPMCRVPFNGPYRADGRPGGFSSGTLHLAWLDWTMNRRRDEAWMPVVASCCDDPLSNFYRQSVIISGGSVIKLGVSLENTIFMTSVLPLENKRVLNINQGPDFCAAVSVMGEVYTWGNGKHGQLGHGDTCNLAVPAIVQMLKPYKVVSVLIGLAYCVALTHRGEVFVWGSIARIRSTCFTAPTRIGAMDGIKVRSASAGYAHVLLVTEGGALYAFGENSFGQLGHRDDGVNYHSEPKLVSALHKLRIASAAAGKRHSLALTEGGSVLTWGANYNHPSSIDSAPVFVDGDLEFVGVRYISTGDGVSCAVSVTGQLFTWGNGEFGRLGHGDDSDRDSPTRVNALGSEFVEKVSVGVEYTLAVTRSGRVFWWGHANISGTRTVSFHVPRVVPNVSCSRGGIRAVRLPPIDMDMHVHASKWERIALMLVISPATAIAPLAALLADDGTIDKVNTMAAWAIQNIAFNSRENGAAFAEVNITAALVKLLRGDASDATKTAVAYALRDLSVNDDIKAQLVHAGAVTTLVALLHGGSVDEMKHAVAGVLSIVASNREIAEQIVNSGAVGTFVAILTGGGSSRGIKIATAKILLAICKDETTHIAFVDTIARLIALIPTETGSECMEVLMILADNTDNRSAFIQAGVFDSLISILRDPYGRFKGKALNLLQRLANNTENHIVMKHAGAIATLVSLLEPDWRNMDLNRNAIVDMLASFGVNIDANGQRIRRTLGYNP